MHNPEAFEYLASGERSASFSGDDLNGIDFNSAYFMVHVSAAAGADTFTVQVHVLDSSSGEWDPVDQMGTTFGTVGDKITYFVGMPNVRGYGISVGLACDLPMPRHWRLHFVNSGGAGVTFSVTCIPVGT